MIYNYMSDNILSARRASLTGNDIKESRLSDILKYNHCVGWGIEPICEESFTGGRTMSIIRFGVFISITDDAPADYSAPSRIIIEPRGPIPSSSQESWFLKTTIMDDLILHYDNTGDPTWVAAINGDRIVRLP